MLQDPGNPRGSLVRRLIPVIAWMILPFAAMILILLSIGRFSAGSEKTTIDGAREGVRIPAVWIVPKPDAAAVLPAAAVLLVHGPEGPPPGTHPLLSALRIRNAHILEIELPDSAGSDDISAAVKVVTARSGVPSDQVRVIATGTSADAALRYAGLQTTQGLVLLDPESYSEAPAPANSDMSMAILAAATNVEEASVSLRPLYEEVSGEDATLIDPADGIGRIRSATYMSADGNVLLTVYPDIPWRLGLAFPAYRDSVLRWSLPASATGTEVRPDGDEQSKILLSVDALALLAAGALLTVFVFAPGTAGISPDGQEKKRHWSGFLLFGSTFLMVALVGLVFRWIWNRPLLEWPHVAAGAVVLVIQMILTGISSMARYDRDARIARTTRGMDAASFLVFLIAALAVWVFSGHEAFALFTAVTGSVCAWGYVRAFDFQIDSPIAARIAGTILLVVLI